MSTKETVIRIGLYVIAMLFFTWCAVTCEAKAAEVIAGIELSRFKTIAEFVDRQQDRQAQIPRLDIVR